VRMRDRGVIRKRLVLLRVAAGAAPVQGDKIATEGQPAAGVVTSSGGIPGQAPLALAVVANAVAVGATVDILHDGAQLSAEVAAESPPWG
jgi:folate-binding Fe-S cluster repair protein YgfZ